uniref:KASH domain-containing protein n=1 Tax=Heliothis virescens TaxID=7102 RepID=A0A2A4IVP8_HELVI
MEGTISDNQSVGIRDVMVEANTVDDGSKIAQVQDDTHLETLEDTPMLIDRLIDDIKTGNVQSSTEVVNSNEKSISIKLPSVQELIDTDINEEPVHLAEPIILHSQVETEYSTVEDNKDNKNSVVCETFKPLTMETLNPIEEQTLEVSVQVEQDIVGKLVPHQEIQPIVLEGLKENNEHIAEITDVGSHELIGESSQPIIFETVTYLEDDVKKSALQASEKDRVQLEKSQDIIPILIASISESSNTDKATIDTEMVVPQITPAVVTESTIDERNNSMLELTKDAISIGETSESIVLDSVTAIEMNQHAFATKCDELLTEEIMSVNKNLPPILLESITPIEDKSVEFAYPNIEINPTREINVSQKDEVILSESVMCDAFAEENKDETKYLGENDQSQMELIRKDIKNVAEEILENDAPNEIKTYMPMILEDLAPIQDVQPVNATVQITNDNKIEKRVPTQIEEVLLEQLEENEKIAVKSLEDKVGVIAVQESVLQVIEQASPIEETVASLEALGSNITYQTPEEANNKSMLSENLCPLILESLTPIEDNKCVPITAQPKQNMENQPTYLESVNDNETESITSKISFYEKNLASEIIQPVILENIEPLIQNEQKAFTKELESNNSDTEMFAPSYENELMVLEQIEEIIQDAVKTIENEKYAKNIDNQPAANEQDYISDELRSCIQEESVKAFTNEVINEDIIFEKLSEDDKNLEPQTHNVSKPVEHTTCAEANHSINIFQPLILEDTTITQSDIKGEIVKEVATEVDTEGSTNIKESVDEIIEPPTVINTDSTTLNTDGTHDDLKSTENVESTVDTSMKAIDIVKIDDMLEKNDDHTIRSRTEYENDDAMSHSFVKRTEQGALINHIDEFISEEVSEVVGEISVLTNSQELKDTIELAKGLKESIEFVPSEESVELTNVKIEQGKLAEKLQDALSILLDKTLEHAEEIVPKVNPNALQKVSEIITHLQEDLEKAIVFGMPDVLNAAEIVEIPEEEGNSMKQLEVLLQEVTDKINIPTVRDVEETEALKDVLDEVQTVIIKLKRDYDGAANDTLNETLEDLECSVRSVQLQINEDSPPELLQEACATLQLLVNNMTETQDVSAQVAETVSVEVKTENILEKCSTDTDETVKLLEEASKANVKDERLSGIVSSLNILKDTIKFLRLSFVGNADVLIEKGVDVVQNLDQLEEKVFTLEKDLAEVNLSTEVRDHILTAIHSVYGSISNMRGTISSIQKRYMFENYGKPSETILRSIKNVSGILEIDDSDKQSWKAFSKSLRKVLNHFEDIKFYINLDKTARLPSDAAFTKIILEELKSNICEIVIPRASVLGPDTTTKVNDLLECLNKYLADIETKSTVEVKEKIPVFLEISSKIYEVTDFIKQKVIEKSKEIKAELLEKEPSEEQAKHSDELLSEQVVPVQQKDDVYESVQELEKTTTEGEETTLDTPSSSQKEVKSVEKKQKARKKVFIQEPDTKAEVEEVASEFVDEITSLAVAAVQNLIEFAGLQKDELLTEATSQSVEVETEQQEAELIENDKITGEGAISSTEDLKVEDVEQELKREEPTEKLEDVVQDTPAKEDEQVASTSVESDIKKDLQISDETEEKSKELIGQQDVPQEEELRPQAELEKEVHPEQSVEKLGIDSQESPTAEVAKESEMEAASELPEEKTDKKEISDENVEQDKAQMEPKQELDESAPQQKMQERQSEEKLGTKGSATQSSQKPEQDQQDVEEERKDSEEKETSDEAQEAAEEKQQTENKLSQENVEYLQEKSEETGKEAEPSVVKEPEKESQQESITGKQQDVEELKTEQKEDLEKTHKEQATQEGQSVQKDVETTLEQDDSVSKDKGAQRAQLQEDDKRHDELVTQEDTEVQKDVEESQLEEKDGSSKKESVVEEPSGELVAEKTKSEEKTDEPKQIDVEAKLGAGVSEKTPESTDKSQKVEVSIQQETGKEQADTDVTEQEIEQSEITGAQDEPLQEDTKKLEKDQIEKEDIESTREPTKQEKEEAGKKKISTEEKAEKQQEQQDEPETHKKELDEEDKALKKEPQRRDSQKSDVKELGQEDATSEPVKKERSETEILEKEDLKAEEQTKQQEQTRAEENKIKPVEGKLAKEQEDVKDLEKERVKAENLAEEQAEKVSEKQTASEELEKQSLEIEQKQTIAEKQEKEKKESELLAKQQAETGKLDMEQKETELLAQKQVEAEEIEKERVNTEQLVKQTEELKLLEESADAKLTTKKEEDEKLSKEQEVTEKLKQEPLESEEISKDQIESEKTQQDVEKLAQEKVEADTITETEAEALGKERVKSEMLAKEQEETDRLEKKCIEAEKHAEKQAKDQVLAKEQAEAEQHEQELIETENLAKEKAEMDKFAKEQAEAEKLEKDRLEAEKLEKERQEAERLEKERLEAERLEKERLEAEKIEKDRVKAEKLAKKQAKAEKLAKEQAEAERLEKERADAEKLEKERLEAEKLEKEQAEAERMEKERLEAEKLEKEQLEAEKLEKEQLEAEKLEKERLEAEKLEKERLEAEKLEKERLEAEKVEKEKLEAENLEKEKLEAEKVEKERVKAEKLAKKQAKAEKLAKEQAEADRLEKERVDAENLEKKRLEAEKLEKERVEAEKREEERLETEKLAKEQAEAERLEAVKQEKERLEAEKLEKERLEAEKLEKERLEAEKVEKERVKAEKLAKKQAKAEKLAKEQAEAEKLEKERLEAEKLEKERAEAEKRDKERLEAEELAKQQAEAEKLAKEQADAERLQKERADAEKLEKERLEAENLEKERVEAEKREKERLKAEELARKQAEAEKIAKEQAEAERLEKERGDAEKLEKQRLEAEKVEKERVKAEKLAKKQAKAEKLAKEQAEAERLEKERADAEKLENERLEAEKVEKERLEAEKVENERLEAEKVERERLEAEKLEKERVETEKLEKERVEAEKVEKERLEAEKLEKERVKAEKLAKKQAKAENLAKEQADAERLEKERLEAEKLEKDRIEAEEKERIEVEKKQIEKLAQEKADKERLEAEKLEKERIEAEKRAQKQAEAEKLEKERIEAEKLEKERIEAEKLEKDRVEAEKLAKERLQAEKLEKERLEAEKLEKKQTEAKKLKGQQVDAEEPEKGGVEKKRPSKKKKKESESNLGVDKKGKDDVAKIQATNGEKLEQDHLKIEKVDTKHAETEKLQEDVVTSKDTEKVSKATEKKKKEGLEKRKMSQSKKEEVEKNGTKTESDKPEKLSLGEELPKVEEGKSKSDKAVTDDKLKAEADKREKEAKAKELENEKLKAEKERQEEERRKKEKDAEKREEKKKLSEKKRKQEEKLKLEQEEKALKEKEAAEKKKKDDERLKEKERLDAIERENKLKQEEVEKQEREKIRMERLEKEKQEEKVREEEEKARLEKKRIAKKKREEEEERMKLETEALEKARKDAAKKRKEEEKARFIKEQEEIDKREQEIRENERRLRKEKRREIEEGLFDDKQKPTSTSELESLDSKPRRTTNGDMTTHAADVEDHYIKEYHYEPTRQRSDERTKFVDHNHRDYTMEFSRPSGYRERTFEHEKFSERESLGRSGTIYKAKTIILDSQLRSSAPPQAVSSDSERRSERYDRTDSDRRVERHRSKALSEARSLVSEKRSGLSRDLKRKPVFSTYLTDRTAVEGSRVKLTCSVLSSSDPKITWYKNGVLLNDKLKYRTKFIDGLITLEVLNAVVSDSAEYTCTVENENGSVNTVANLKVYPSFEASPIPPTFTRSIRDTYHLAENELVLECRIRGQPLPTITWLKDDKPIATSERYQAYYLADGVCRLSISSPTPEDSGKYTCKAENSVWTDQITHIVSFTGKESRLSPNLATRERSHFNRQALESRRPHFTNVLSDYKVVKGGTIGLQVEIRGCPTRVEWLREGRSVTEIYRNARTFVEQGLYTLALSDVTEKESGLYTCRAWSTHGNVDMNAAITVVPPTELEGKPAIIAGRPDKDILISVGEDVNISFRVQGEPKPKVVFMKGIRDITTSQRVCKMTSDDYVKFTLKRSVVSDAGTYCILARNAYGCDRAFVTVVVRQRASSENLISDWTYPLDDSALSISERKYKSVPDRIPGEPSVVDGGNNWVSLAWPKADPRDTAPVLAYKIESWLLGKEGGARWVELGITPLNSFDAFNLKQGEEYHFRVTPRNRYGWGEAVQTSTPVGIGLAGDRPEFVEILPGQLKVLAGETANLSCSVKGKPVPEIVWMKNGHEIEEESRMTTLYNGQDCSLTIKDICIEDEARYSCEASNVHGRASTYARLAVVTDRLIWEADAKLKRERSQDAEGDYPPQFTMRLRDRRVQATYPVRLTCQVVGGPPPTLTWFKDGEHLVLDSRRSVYQDEHFHTLEIAPTTLEDGGVYEAMARNSSGAVSCRCSLVVDKGIRAYVAPEFCCGLEPLYRLREGDELRISAVVEAYPSVGVTWYRDGVRLRPSRRAIMTLDRDGQIELALAFVTCRDAGVYTCTASNEVGRASTSGKVEVVAGAQSREKRTPPVVINAPDERYSKEPMFVRKPRSSEAREGDTVIIACEVIGDPKPDVYWLRDFLKPDYYRDATHFKRVGDGPEYRFEIPHAKLDYTGAYSVVARNVHGEAKAIISLQIKAKDPSADDTHNIRYGRVEVIPRFERELTDLLSYDGDAVEFECHVTGNPEPDIRWFHYNELIRDCEDFESTFDDGAARLKIKQVTAEDEGTYSCEASNNLGKATSSACLVVYPPGEPNTLSQRLRRPPALLSAASTPRSTPRSTPARSVSRTPGPDTRRLCSPSRQMAPSFYTYPFNKVVEEGETVTFKCAVKGQPSPWATWDKDGIIITPSARFTIKEKDELLRILEIEQVTIEDVGVYRITIENEFGRAEASARLEVITQKGKFYAGVRAYSASPRKSLTYRRYPSVPRQD